MKREILEMLIAAVLFVTMGVSASVIRREMGPDDSWEIAEVKAGQSEASGNVPPAVFESADFSRAVVRAVARHSEFKIRSRGRKPKNPGFNFTLLFFVKGVSVSPSGVVTGGFDACVGAAMMLTDTRDESERFSGSFRGCAPIAPQALPERFREKARDNGQARTSGAENSAADDPPEFRAAFDAALFRTLSAAFDAAVRDLKFQEMDDAELIRTLADVQGCPPDALLSVLADRRPQEAFDALLVFVQSAKSFPSARESDCLSERLRAAAILGTLGRREAVLPLIDFAQRSEDVSSMKTLLTPIAALGGDTAKGYMFLLSSGHLSETIRRAAAVHFEEMASREDSAGDELSDRASEDKQP